MTMSRNWMMRKISTPIAPATTSNRHDQAAAVRMAGATASSPAAAGGSAFGRQNIAPVYESEALRPLSVGAPAPSSLGAPAPSSLGATVNA
jgi:hypothetical protein